MGAPARGLMRDCVLWKFLSPDSKRRYIRKLQFIYAHRHELISNPSSDLFDNPAMNFELSNFSVDLLSNLENIEELYWDIIAFDDLRVESASA